MNSPNTPAVVTSISNRLSMRPLSPADESLFVALYSDSATMQFIGPALQEDVAKRTFQRALNLMQRSPSRHQYFALVSNEVSRVQSRTVGILSIQQMDDVVGAVQAGIVLLPAARTRGYAKQAMRALVSHALQSPHVAEVRVFIAVGNVAAERVAASVGFEHCPGCAADPGLTAWTIRRAAQP